MSKQATARINRDTVRELQAFANAAQKQGVPCETRSYTDGDLTGFSVSLTKAGTISFRQRVKKPDGTRTNVALHREIAATFGARRLTF